MHLSARTKNAAKISAIFLCTLLSVFYLAFLYTRIDTTNRLALADEFSPDQIGGLTTWLRADSITANNGDRIETWSNEGSGNDFTNSNVGQQPQYITNALNNKPVLYFDDGKYLDASITTESNVNIFVVTADQKADPINGLSVLLASKTAGGGDGFAINTSNSFISTSEYKFQYEGPGVSAASVEKNGVSGDANIGLSYQEYAVGYYELNNVVSQNLLRVGGFTDAIFTANSHIAEILVFNSDLAVSEKNSVYAYLETKYGIDINIQASNQSFTPLTSRNERLKGAMYWPRKATEMHWWLEYLNGDITDQDLRDDLQLMKNDLGINTVRVFLYYDYKFKTTGTVCFVDGSGVVNQAMVNKVSTFLDLANEYQLDVLPTMFMGLNYDNPGGLGSGTYLQDNYAAHENYLEIYTQLFENKTNVPSIILLNEPDGFGAWSDNTRATNLLVWLKDLKDASKQVFPGLNVYVNSSTHDNSFVVFPGAPIGSQSIYQISDALAFNSFLWADNGYWEFQVPPNIYEYANTNNTLNKPIILTEFGWPSDYDETGIVVANQQWDKPLGHRPTTPSTLEMQEMAYNEFTYWIDKFNIDGTLAWSAFDHVPGSYQDPFSMIEYDGTPKESANLFKRLFTDRAAPSSGRMPWSLLDGEVSGGGAKLNGRNGTTSTPAGVDLPAGTSYTSSILPYKIPMNIEVSFKHPGNIPSAYGAGIGIQFVAGGLNQRLWVRRDEANNEWEVWNSNEQIAGTQASYDSDLNNQEHSILFEMSSDQIIISFDNSQVILYEYNGSLSATPFQYNIGSVENSADIRILADSTGEQVNITNVRIYDTPNEPYVTNFNINKNDIFNRILNVQSGFSAVRRDNYNINVSNTVQRGDKFVRLINNTNIAIADINTNFATDRNWSGIQLGLDAYKSFLYFTSPIANIPGNINNNFTLYVPKKATHNRLLLCSNVTSVSNIISGCSGEQVFNDTTEFVNVINIDGQEYWRITNLTSSTGGYSYEYVDPTPTPTPTPSPTDTPTPTTTPTENPQCSVRKTQGDTNCDGQVNLTDLSVLAFYWNQNNTQADFNGDNIVNLSDLSILAFNWGKNI